MEYTGKECDVSPYRDDYQMIHNIPIVTSETSWKSPITGETFILVLNETIWMGEQINTTLINTNQLCYHGIEVQDNPTSHLPLGIYAEEDKFVMELTMNVTIVSVYTYTPTETELLSCKHIQLTSISEWDPKNFIFPKCPSTLEY